MNWWFPFGYLLAIALSIAAEAIADGIRSSVVHTVDRVTFVRFGFGFGTVMRSNVRGWQRCFRIQLGRTYHLWSWGPVFDGVRADGSLVNRIRGN